MGESIKPKWYLYWLFLPHVEEGSKEERTTGGKRGRKTDTHFRRRKNANKLVSCTFQSKKRRYKQKDWVRYVQGRTDLTQEGECVVTSCRWHSTITFQCATNVERIHLSLSYCSKGGKEGALSLFLGAIVSTKYIK